MLALDKLAVRQAIGALITRSSAMNVFTVRDSLIGEYAQYVEGFMHIRDPHIAERVGRELRDGLLWPEPLLQLNPSFEPGRWIDELVRDETRHASCVPLR
jgi:hypothetical protein